MHLPPSALPGAALLLQDPAAQAVFGQVFGRRPERFWPGPMFAEGWTAPALLNSWVNFGAPYANAGFTKNADGTVRLRGVLKSGTVGLAAFTLPVGYRPLSQLLLATSSNNLFGVVEILASGNVQLTAGSNVSFSLDGITFRTS